MSAEGRNILEAVLNTNIAKKFDEVDNAVSKLQTAMQTAADSAGKFAEAMENMSKSFNNAGQMGDVTEKLQTIINSLERLNTTSGATGLEQTQKSVVSLGESVGQNINMITQLINVLNKIGSTSSGIDYGKVFVEGMGKSLKQLKDEVDEINDKLFGKNAVPLTNRAEQALVDEREILKEIIALRTKSTKSKDESYERAYSQHQKEMTELELKRFKDSEEQRRKDFEDEQRNLHERKKAWEGYFKEQDSAEKKSIEEKKAAEKEIMSLYEQRIKLEAKQKGVLLKYTEEENTKGRASKLTSLRSEYDSLGRSIEQINAKLKAFEANYRVIVAKGERSYANKELELQIRYLEQYQALMLKVSEAEQDENKKMLSNQKSEELQKEMNLLKEYVDLLKKQDELEKKREPLRAKIGTTGLTQEELSYYTALNGLISQNVQRMNELAQVSAAVTSYEAKRVYSGEQAVKEKEDEIRLADAIRKAEDSAAKEKARQDKEALELSLKQLETKRKIAEANRYSYSGAVKYSQNTRSLEQEKNAIDALKIARDRLNQSSYDYEIKLKVLNEEIKRHKDNIDRATGATTKFKEENRKLGITLRDVASTFGVYIGLQSLTNLARRVRETTGEFELQHRALQAIIQDTQAANQIWDKTIKLAVRSPYNVKQLVTYTKQLAAYRVESDKLYDTTKMLADISSGLGVDMQRLILAYGQVKAANYLRGQELRQFSEAGINILGELAKYFTELKGQAVSTGQVFEMVSKRMVKFEDVAEVLHRLTEEGGAFYKMQEIQAETLSGVYANLKDRVDIALNSMGEDTRGVLVGLAKAATYLLENWRAFSNMLTSGMIIWGFYKLEVLRAARAKGAFTAATIQATAAEGGFIGMLAKSKLALKAFATSIKTIFTTGLGIAGVVIAALVAIGKAIYDHNKKIDEARKKYDELNQGINKNGISGFNRLNDAIQENNKKISENIKLRDKAKDAGEKEKEVQLQAEINQLQEKNNKLVDDIRGKYSELSDEIQTTADGIVEIGAGAKELAHIQTMTTDITNIFGENAGRRSDITETTKDLELAFNELDLATSQFGTQFTYWINKVENKLENSTEFSDSFKESIHGIIDDRTLSSFEKYNLILDKLNSNYYQYSGVFGSIGNEFVKGVEKAQSKVDKLEGSISEEVGRVSEKIKEMYDVAGDKESAQKASEGFIKNLGFLKGNVSDFLARMFSEKLDIEVTITPNDEKKELLEWQDKVNEFIQKTVGSKNRETTIPISAEITNADETRDAYRKMVKGLIDDAEEIIRVFEKAKKEGTKQLVYTVDEYNNAVSKLPDLKALYDAIGGEYKKKGGKSNPALELLNKQIEAIKNATKQYDEYKKLYDDTSAFDKTKEAVKGLFDELNIGNLLNKSDVFNEEAQLKDDSGIKNWLSASIAAAGKAGNQAAEKYLRELRLRLDQEDFKKDLEGMKKNMEKAFADYDMYKELNKLGIGKDFASLFFDVQTNDLQQLRDKLAEQAKTLKNSLGEYYKGSDAQKAIQEMEKKISDIEDKEQKERLKKYIKYTEQAMTERAKIQVDGLAELAEIEETFMKEIDKADNAGNEQRSQQIEEMMKQAIEASKQATDEKLKKQAWEDFKGTDMYISLFQDLDNASTKALTTMQEKLDELKGTMKGLEDTTALKNIVESIEKLENELVERNPFRNLIKYWKEIKEMEKGGVTEETLNSDYEASISRIEEISTKIEGLQQDLYILEHMSQGEIDQMGQEKWEEELAAKRKEISLSQQTLSITKKESNSLAEMLNKYKLLRNATKTFQEQWKEGSGMIKGVITSLMDNLDAFGVETNNTTDAWKDLLGSIMDIIGIIPMYVAMMTAAGVAVNSSLGIIGLIAEAIQLVITLVAGLAMVNDAKIDDQIDQLQAKIDGLKDTYDRLEKKFEEVWNVDRLIKYRRELEENINQQIKYINAQIAAEYSRKTPDKDKIHEWEEAIRDLRDDLKGNTEKFLQELGGIGGSEYKSAAQEFVDSWYDAFKETGFGIDGLKEHFNEILENMVKKQAMQRVAQRFLEPLFTSIDKAVGENGIVTPEEINDIRSQFESLAPQLSSALEAIFTSLGLFGDQAEGELDGLQKGIQGVTEQTAEIIAAYMNSIRFYVIDNNTKIGQLINIMQDSTGGVNPMINELRNIRTHTANIENFLSNWNATSGIQAMKVTIV